VSLRMVLSEALKPAPEEAVPWLAEQNRDAVFTNGNYSCRNPVWVLTPGKCRSLLHAAVERLLTTNFADVFFRSMRLPCWCIRRLSLNECVLAGRSRNLTQS
jgi:hypothetical protein